MPAFTTGGLIDHSQAVGASSEEILPANSGRVYLLIVNTDDATDCWINPTGGDAGDPASNSANRGSFKLQADGGYYEMVGPFVNGGVFNAKADSGTIELTVLEA